MTADQLFDPSVCRGLAGAITERHGGHLSDRERLTRAVLLRLALLLERDRCLS